MGHWADQWDVGHATMGQDSAAELRHQVEAAVAGQIGQLGPDGVDKAAIVRRFSGMGAGRSTLYRWIDARGVLNITTEHPPAGRSFTIVQIDPNRNIVPMSGEKAGDGK